MSLASTRSELLQKSIEQIQEETAFTWAARAVVSYQLHVEDGTERRLRDAIEYYHEALEHAALADHTGAVLRSVRQWVYEHGVPHGVI